MLVLDNFINWFTKLKVEDLNEIDKYYAKETFFKDPFNEFSGREQVKKIFEHMFEQLSEPRFEFIDIISNDKSSFLSWDFFFIYNNRNFKIHGSTHLKWDDNQKINYHRDYWDVGEELLSKVPVVKSIYGLFVRKLRVC